MLKLKDAWSKRLALKAEGNKLWEQGADLCDRADKIRDRVRGKGGEFLACGGVQQAKSAKLWAEGAQIRAEGDRLRAGGYKLWADSTLVWAEAVLNAYGNVTMTWAWNTPHGECTLENGDTYGA